jgi:Bacteriocin-protection, YdeI or OmpD-Associated
MNATATGWVTFDGRVEPLTWGRATYTILRLPDEVALALGRCRRVEGEIAEHPVNLALSRAPVVEGVFLWTGSSLLDRIGISPGKPVEVRLRPAPDDRVDVDPDIAAALRSGAAAAAWEALTPGKRRGMLYQIATARTDATRQKRIAKLVADLSGGKPGAR